MLDVDDARYATILEPAVDDWGEDVEYILMVAPRLPIAGTVVDEGGAPIAAADVYLTQPVIRSEVLRITDHSKSNEDLHTLTDNSGHFEFPDAWAPDPVDLIAGHPGYENSLASEGTRGRTGVEIVLRRPRGITTYLIQGRVVDPADQPVAFGYVYTEPRTAANGDRVNGRGEFAISPSQPKSASEPWCLMAAAPGFLPQRFEGLVGSPRSLDDWPNPVIIRLTSPSLSIEGQLIDATGQVVSHASITLVDGTPFDDVTNRRASIGHQFLEGVLSGRRVNTPFTTNQNGQFEIRGLLPREYRLRFVDGLSLNEFISEPIAAGSRDILVHLPEQDSIPIVAGRVLSTDKTPIKGARVSLSTSRETTASTSLEGPISLDSSAAKTTDEFGRFEFTRVSKALGSISVRPNGSDTADTWSIDSFADLSRIELLVSPACHAQIDLRGTGIEADLAMLDSGEPNANVFTIVEGSTSRTQRSIELQHGRSQSFVIRQSASSMGLYSRGDRAGTLLVRRIALKLEPGRLNVIRP